LNSISCFHAMSTDSESNFAILASQYDLPDEILDTNEEDVANVKRLSESKQVDLAYAKSEDAHSREVDVPNSFSPDEVNARIAS
jgi:hypothetical protein